MRYDAVIVGAGAAGSVLAYELARRGLSVAVIECGRREEPQTFVHSELPMFARLYKEGGLQTTRDRAIIIAQGQTVGGSTVINNAIWLRPDLDAVLPEWKAAGAEVDRGRLEAAYAELETALRVSPIPVAMANAGTAAFLDGAKRTGLAADYLKHNRDTCIGCGWCNFGCAYNRKLSMLVTYIPWAERRGATFIDRCRNARLRLRGKRAIGVSYERDDITYEINADRVVVSAGAIGSSILLLNSGISLDGRVGDGFHLLGGVNVLAEMSHRVNGFDKIGLTAYMSYPGVVIESFSSPPVTMALAVGGQFRYHALAMSRYAYFANCGVMVGTGPRGRVSVDKRGVRCIDLTLAREDLQSILNGVQAVARAFLSAGAVRVLPATFDAREMRTEQDIVKFPTSIRGSSDLALGSAHPQGGNPMCEDPQRGVVDARFSVHGYERLFVVDTSVSPTNIRANCQATAMAIAHLAADHVSAS